LRLAEGGAGSLLGEEGASPPAFSLTQRLIDLKARAREPLCALLRARSKPISTQAERDEAVLGEGEAVEVVPLRVNAPCEVEGG
jgi:hypothetical protein